MFDPDHLMLVETPLWTTDSTYVPVTSISYSPNGTSVVYSNGPSQVYVADVATGKIDKILSQNYTTCSLAACFFHPVEDDFVVAVFKDGHMLVFDAQSNEVVRQCRHNGSNIVAAAPDTYGEIYAIGCADGSIRVYDIDTMKRTTALVKLTGRSAGNQSSVIHDLIFNPEDSNIILSAVGNDRVLFWDTRTGNPERAIIGPHIRGHGIAMYDNHVYTASLRDSKQFEVWDFRTGRKIKEIPVPRHLSNVAISKNGLDLVTTVAELNYGIVYGYENTNVLGRTAPLTATPSALAISPMGTTFVMGSEQGDLACYKIKLRDN